MRLAMNCNNYVSFYFYKKNIHVGIPDVEQIGSTFFRVPLVLALNLCRVGIHFGLRSAPAILHERPGKEPAALFRAIVPVYYMDPFHTAFVAHELRQRERGECFGSSYHLNGAGS